MDISTKQNLHKIENQIEEMQKELFNIRIEIEKITKLLSLIINK